VIVSSQKHFPLRLFALTLFCSFAVKTFSQGCSDAGVCTIGSLRSDAMPMGTNGDSTTRNLKHTLVITPAISFGEQNTVNFTPSFDATFQIFKRFHANVKTGFNLTSGDLGFAYGASDLFVSGIFYFIKSDSMNLSFVAGGKFALEKADFTIDNKVLPLSYQSTVGTNDILFGLSFNYKTWYLGVGFQHSLTESSNTFHFSDYDSSSAALGYFESNRLQRAPDVVLRFEKKFFIKKIRLGLGAGFIWIHHLDDDTQFNDAGERITIDGSKGTTLNLIGNITYKISPTWSCNFGVGFPVIVRDVRPDGLTRSLVLLPSVTYSF